MVSPPYSVEPGDKRRFTESFDRAYSRFARLYDLGVRALPIWRRWLRQALPLIEGPRVLEVSFGIGWLLTRHAGRVEASGIDLNSKMVAIARRNLERAGVGAELEQANVESLPFADTSSASGAPLAAWRSRIK